jgi:hypothetical protein
MGLSKPVTDIAAACAALFPFRLVEFIIIDRFPAIYATKKCTISLFFKWVRFEKRQKVKGKGQKCGIARGDERYCGAIKDSANRKIGFVLQKQVCKNAGIQVYNFWQSLFLS